MIPVVYNCVREVCNYEMFILILLQHGSSCCNTMQQILAPSTTLRQHVFEGTVAMLGAHQAAF